MIVESNNAGGSSEKISDLDYSEKAMWRITSFARNEAMAWRGETWTACEGLNGKRYVDCVQYESNKRILYMLARGCIGVRALACEGREEFDK
jgi:hypothetical protein